MKARNILAGVALAAATIVPAIAQAQQPTQYFPIPSMRVGPYNAMGTGIYGGAIDYLNYVNIKHGGVNGVKLVWEECETEYNAARNVECYQRLMTKSAPRGVTGFNWAECQSAFLQGKVGMWLDGVGFAPPLENPQKSRVVGKVGSTLGAAGVNIADIHLARRPGGDAIAVLRVDEVPSEAALAALRALDVVSSVRFVALG